MTTMYFSPHLNKAFEMDLEGKAINPEYLNLYRFCLVYSLSAGLTPSMDDYRIDKKKYSPQQLEISQDLFEAKQQLRLFVLYTSGIFHSQDTQENYTKCQLYLNNVMERCMHVINIEHQDFSAHTRFCIMWTELGKMVNVMFDAREVLKRYNILFAEYFIDSQNSAILWVFIHLWTFLLENNISQSPAITDDVEEKRTLRINIIKCIIYILVPCSECKNHLEAFMRVESLSEENLFEFMIKLHTKLRHENGSFDDDEVKDAFTYFYKYWMSRGALLSDTITKKR